MSLFLVSVPTRLCLRRTSFGIWGSLPGVPSPIHVLILSVLDGEKPHKETLVV